MLISWPSKIQLGKSCKTVWRWERIAAWVRGIKRNPKKVVSHEYDEKKFPSSGVDGARALSAIYQRHPPEIGQKLRFIGGSSMQRGVSS